jgi:hypothetical protein
VDHPALVAVVHGVADAGEQIEAIAGRQPVLLGKLGDRLGAGDVLHGEEGHGPGGVLVRARLVDLGDAGVPQAAEDVGLVGEATKRGRRREAGLDDLQRYQPLGMILHRLEDGAHSS